MNGKRRKYLNTIAKSLNYYVRTMEGFAAHPTYFDKSVIEFLDKIIKEED